MATTMKQNKAARREPLEPERIYRTALELIEQGGIEQLSMRKLAGALGVDAMSIYHHVANKDALLTGVYQRVLAELELPPVVGLSWQDCLRQLAVRFYALARRYPRVMPHLIGSPVGAPRTLEIYQFVRDTVARTGLPPHDQARATAAIYTYAFGVVSVAVNGLSPERLYRPEQGGEPAPAPVCQALDTQEDVAFSVELVIGGIERYCDRQQT